MPYCVNCDNRHGCKNGAPPCERIAREAGSDGTGGKALLIALRQINHCERCAYFRQCWRNEEYRHALNCQAGDD